MGKWRNTDDSGEGSRPKMSDEQKKKKKASGEPKATTANETKQTEPAEERSKTVVEDAMLGNTEKMTAEEYEKIKGDPRYKQAQDLGKRHEATGKKHSGAKMQQAKLINELNPNSGIGGGKKKGGGKSVEALPEGANPDEYYTGRWRTGKKPTPTPEAPKPPENVSKFLPIVGTPIEDMPPFPGYPGYPPQPKFPERGDIGGGPGQFPYPMPMPQPSWPPRGIGGFPPYYNPVPPWAQLPSAPTTGTPELKMTIGTPGNWW